MTPEEMDQAAKKKVGYRPPGKEPRFGTVTGAERPSALRDGVRVYIAGPRWHHRPAMAIRRTQQLTNGHSRRIDRATFQPGDYGRVTQADGIDRWWVRSSNGEWIALSHQRVVENDVGTITLLYLN